MHKAKSVCLEITEHNQTSAMRLLHPIFLSMLIVLTTLSSCTTFRAVQNSGVLNTMAIELDDDNVTYERLESRFSRETFAGFLPNASSKNVVEATVISNNNGTTNSKLTASFGANFLAALTLVGTSATIYGTLREEGSLENGPSAAIAAVLGLALNELYWRPFNQNRMQGEALQSAMNQNSDADFYCFPYAEFEMKPSLFSTRWSGTQRIVAANISDDIIPDFSASNGLAPQTPPSPSNAPKDEMDAPAEQSSLETETDESIAAPRIESLEIEDSRPTINGKVVKIGSTGTYQTSKKRTSNVRVVNILNFQEGNPEFQIAIVIGNAYQRIIQSTDPKFTLD